MPDAFEEPSEDPTVAAEDVPAIFSLFDKVAAMPAGKRALLAAISLAVAFAADIAAPRELSILGIYLVPLTLVVWMFSDSVAWVVCTASAFVACAVEEANGLGLASAPLLTLAVLFRALFFVAVSFAVHDVKLAHRVLEQRSEHDALTGIFNRRGFRRVAAREMERARRHDRPMCVAFLDIDDFKRINDVRGHAAGDRLLALVGHTLATGRQLDIVARIGGDEFVVLMPETTQAGARVAIERLRRRFERALEHEGLRATFTTGLAVFGRTPRDVETVLEEADRLLLEGKRVRKGSVRTRASFEGNLARST